VLRNLLKLIVLVGAAGSWGECEGQECILSVEARSGTDSTCLSRLLQAVFLGLLPLPTAPTQSRVREYLIARHVLFYVSPVTSKDG